MAPTWHWVCEEGRACAANEAHQGGPGRRPRGCMAVPDLQHMLQGLWRGQEEAGEALRAPTFEALRNRLNEGGRARPRQAARMLAPPNALV